MNILHLLYEIIPCTFFVLFFFGEEGGGGVPIAPRHKCGGVMLSWPARCLLERKGRRRSGRVCFHVLWCPAVSLQGGALGDENRVHLSLEGDTDNTGLERSYQARTLHTKRCACCRMELSLERIQVPMLYMP